MAKNTIVTHEGETEPPKASLGNSPAFLTNRPTKKTNPWCRKTDIEYDHLCDPENPKDIGYKCIIKAASAIKHEIPKTPLLKSKYCEKFEIDLHYKLEIFHYTGSFKERGALFALKKLTDDQKRKGVITASTGNWALALAYYGRQMDIPVVLVLPKTTSSFVVEKCEDFSAWVIRHGQDMADAKRQAFEISCEGRFTYINGYDHPHVIAACGSIGLEILEELPHVDAILVPVGGGGLIAGVAVAVKHLKPSVMIYGIESDKNCSFFKALENDRPYRTKPQRGLAESLEVPEVGCNAFYTARSLIDKMVLVDDDWIAQSILHLAEKENFITEGAGAASLSPLMTVPKVLPELCGKTVVCIISGGNMDLVNLPYVMQRAQAIEGRLIKMKITLLSEEASQYSKVMSMIKNVGANVLEWNTEPAWHEEDQLQNVVLNVICETQSLEHACTLKRVMERLFPDMFDFEQEPYSPIPICPCYPKRFP